MNCHLLYVCQYFGPLTVNRMEHNENGITSLSRNWKSDKNRKDWCVVVKEVNKLNVCQNYSLFTLIQTILTHTNPLTWVDHHRSINSSKTFSTNFHFRAKFKLYVWHHFLVYGWNLFAHCLKFSRNCASIQQQAFNRVLLCTVVRTYVHWVRV